MVRILLISFLFCFPMFTSYAGGDDDKRLDLGFDMGIRNTYSFFGGTGNDLGLGYGGQLRLKLSDRINTEWYADYITTNLDGLGKRETGHIGWSVMFYPYKYQGGTLLPYFVAGHCFDYAKVTPNNLFTERSNEFVERWSSAMQVGLGSHLILTEMFDVSFNAQYMSHLGNHLDTSVKTDDFGNDRLEVHEGGSSVFLEGHLLLTMSMNIKLVGKWK